MEDTFDFESDVQKTGSIRPIEGKCGVKLRRSLQKYGHWRYCKKDPLKGRKRCNRHGGTQLRGAQHHSFKDGAKSMNPMYQEVFSGKLLDAYLHLQGDEELLSLEEQIRIWTARESELVVRATKRNGESGEAWVRAQRLVREIRGLRRGELTSEKFTAVVERIDKLSKLIDTEADREAAWYDQQRCTNTLRRLKEAHRKHLESQHKMLSADQMMQLVRLLTLMALKHIVGDEARAAYKEHVAKLMAGEPTVVIDSEDEE